MPVWNSTTFGGAIANANDHLELLSRLIDALTGVAAPSIGTLPTVQRWTVLRDDSTSVTGERHVFLQGPGLTGNDSIFVNIRAFSGALNIRNWEIRGATAFASSSDFYTQPGTQPLGRATIFTLRNIEMPFRIIANGRRFIVLPRIVASYFACYCGLYLPFATPTEFPYPLIIAANANSRLTYASDNDYRIGNFYDGPSAFNITTDSQPDFNHSCFSIRDRNGVWIQGGRYRGLNNAATGRPNTIRETLIWPWDYGNASNIGVASTQRLFDHGLFTTNDPILPNVVIPSIVYTVDGQSTCFGELEGVYYSPTGNKSTEDILTIGLDSYYCIHNTYRDNEVNAAFLLE